MAEIVNLKSSGNILPRVRPQDAEYTLSIIGLTLAASGQSLVALIICAIALKESKRAGRYNVFALIGLILGIVFTVLTLLFFIVYIIIIAKIGLFSAASMSR